VSPSGRLGGFNVGRAVGALASAGHPGGVVQLDALIVASPPWGEAPQRPARPWSGRPTGAVLHPTVVVLNDSDGHADKRTRAVLR
jgi:hypothetical protein